MNHCAEEVAFHVHTREAIAEFGVADAQTPHELDLCRFEITEHGRVMNSATGVSVDETDASLKTKWLPRVHLNSMSFVCAGESMLRNAVLRRIVSQFGIAVHTHFAQDTCSVGADGLVAQP